ncbi:hypothetical protein R1flu_016344 [Riccia fluitans]|uniref:Acid phosphatase/vanadium-dependent haloperoxidase-related protein n=1 Tax=Riccia fluitans TaxID=41844 RepID=A0ABD1YM52_9MARC
MSIACEAVGCSVPRQSRGSLGGCRSSLHSRTGVILRVSSRSKVKGTNETFRFISQSRFERFGLPTSRGYKNQRTECRKIVCKGSVSSSSTNAGNSFPGPSNLAPLAVLALTFSRAASFMASMREEIRQRRIDGECAEREFCEAAEKNLPWKSGMMKGLACSGGFSMAMLSTTAKDHLTPVLLTLRGNPTFMSGLIAWAIAQVMKVFTYYFVVRKWDFRMVMGSGGMPSSHSALCFALTTSVALVHGVADALFPVCLGFTLIVMYDAAGVRRHAGKQAEILNIIVADMFQGHPISERKLKELLVLSIYGGKQNVLSSVSRSSFKKLIMSQDHHIATK